jgi:hypothetical protein
MDIIEFSSRLGKYLQGNEVLLEQQLLTDTERKVNDNGIVITNEKVKMITTISIPIHILFEAYQDILKTNLDNKIDRMINKTFYSNSGEEIDPGYKKYLIAWKNEGITFD